MISGGGSGRKGEKREEKNEEKCKAAWKEEVGTEWSVLGKDGEY